MGNPIDVRIKALQRQLMTLEKFASTPSGIFETLDQMVKNFRMANRETIASLGLKLPGGAVSGQLKVLRKIQKTRPKLLMR